MEIYKGYYSRKFESYNEHPDLLNWIENDSSNPLRVISDIISDGKKILDIGCGNGILGRLVKRRNPLARIRGVEPSLERDCPGLYDYERYFQGYLSNALHLDWIVENDCFVFADVIEHIPYPDEILHELVNKTASTSRYVFSVPNIGYFDNRIRHLKGEWKYSESGILESTHLRFFTLSSFIEMLKHVGLFPSRIVLLNRVLPPGDKYLDLSMAMLAGLIAMPAQSFPFCYQFIVEASTVPTEEINFSQVGVSDKKLLLRNLLKGFVKKKFK